LVGPKSSTNGKLGDFSLLEGKFSLLMGKILVILSSNLGKVLHEEFFSLKKGKKIIYLYVEYQLHIFGEKFPRKKISLSIFISVGKN